MLNVSWFLLKVISFLKTDRKSLLIASNSYVLALAFATVLNIGCSLAPKHPEKEPNTVSVMAFNVENLFDTEHDEGTGDFEYLPIKRKSGQDVIDFCAKQEKRYQESCLSRDWSEKILKTKMHRIADTIKQVSYAKISGPDIVILSEVENERVLRRLVDQHLADSGYQTVAVIEGDDKRGIDIGIISRLPLASAPKLHRIDFSAEVKKISGEVKTRGILEVPLLLPNNKTLHVFGLHFPSQANPTQQRRDAVKTLNNLIKQLPENAYALAGGDFNITSKEDLQHGYYAKTLSERWHISHLVGCKTCDGTHNYKGEWSFLDAILFGKKDPNNSSLYLKTESIRVLKGGKYQMGEKPYPLRFESENSLGVSDHLPIFAELKIKD